MLIQVPVLNLCINYSQWYIVFALISLSFLLIVFFYYEIIGFSLSKWKSDEKVPTLVQFPEWAKHLLLEYLDIAQYMNPIPCKRGVGMFFDQSLIGQNYTNSTEGVLNSTLSSYYLSQSKLFTLNNNEKVTFYAFFLK